MSAQRLEYAAKRRAICSGCEHRRPVPVVRLHRCRLCGCIVEGKTLLRGAKCPAGKW